MKQIQEPEYQGRHGDAERMDFHGSRLDRRIHDRVLSRRRARRLQTLLSEPERVVIKLPASAGGRTNAG